ncbi:MAG TPA: type 2 isopentenyl-diphosphate Delta-isomerase [Pseudobdellovibrionaceae bacterium]|nr:type 2 isopentenyl-diphosphate Delta-isomerase [Pseudobdellovibrionaceae bacterium]
MAEQDPQFEQRKRDHIRIALDSKAQSEAPAGFESIELLHEALPDLDFSDIDLRTKFQNHVLSVPFFISSMTAGHEHGEEMNRRLAVFSQERGLLMGVGSQRKELQNGTAAQEWKKIRSEAPRAVLLGNLGMAQLIESGTEPVLRLIENLQAAGIFIHLNPLQEVLQLEGTPRFKGGLRALEALVKASPVPVIVKETGSGFSRPTLERFQNAGVAAVDVSGRGGTHWGRVETLRINETDWRSQSGSVFADWGVSTVQSMMNAKELSLRYQLWASGGVRNGLDVAKLTALGAEMVGLAQPWLQAVMSPEPMTALATLADRIEYELKVALFCTGSRTPSELREKWTWRKL